MSTLFEVTAHDAAARDLPPIGIRLDTAGAGLVSAAPGDDVYGLLSGPPGGPLFLKFFALRAAASLPSLDARISRDFSGAELAGSQELTLAGHSAITRLFFTGQAHPLSATANLAIAFKELPGGDDSLVIVAGQSGKPDAVPDAAALLEREPFASLFARLQFEA